LLQFIFCPIEKAGSTLWRQLFYRLAGDIHWYEPPWHKTGLELFRNLPINVSESYLNDPSWTKAVFFRDPTRRLAINKTTLLSNFSYLRLLSAYIHLIQNTESQNNYPSQLKKLNLSRDWGDFWQSASSRNGIRNLHWRPQVQLHIGDSKNLL